MFPMPTHCRRFDMRAHAEFLRVTSRSRCIAEVYDLVNPLAIADWQLTKSDILYTDTKALFVQPLRTIPSLASAGKAGVMNLKGFDPRLNPSFQFLQTLRRELYEIL
ncbi:hypothetical protein SeMB42_g05523 [Synchytrium endobioticum]|uniref:Uncharacterized protein n=1 Tax=Synchytrium endobioticum TaxID=286115 RepID=A0A507CQW4_9FUNG|nr:hypothetical protein SeMB42_g05523 [Synchytrium endobioticum]